MAFYNRICRFSGKHTLLILMILAVINGLIFIFIVPPWEHFDEPGHFEYAWLAANQPGWPQEGDYDQSMRREVGASMLEHDFHEYSIYQLLKTSEPISIIVAQTGDLPLYYFLASLPLRIFKHSDITFQLYTTRFVSFSLFLLVIWMSWQTCKELFGVKHPLAWMVPLFMINLPSFIDLMTAANNDVAAIASFSAFIWISTILIRRGFTLKRSLFFALAILLCIFAKSTAWLVIPLSIFVVFLSLVKPKHMKYAWMILVIGLILTTAIIFSWQSSAPALFYADYDATISRQDKRFEAPLGEWVIVHDIQTYRNRSFYHMLTPQVNQALSGQPVTLGAYIWADTPTIVYFPVIETLNKTVLVNFYPEPVALTTQPQFIAFSAQMPENDAVSTWVRFYPSYLQGSAIYWDGLVLVPGTFSNQSPPTYLDSNAAEIQWAGQTLTNLIRNASGEKPWPVFSPLARRIVPQINLISTSKMLSIFDTRTTAWYFQSYLQRFFRSFWGIFGWSEVNLLGTNPYRYLAAFSFLAVLGGVVSLYQKSVKVSKKAALFLVVTTLAQFVLVSSRGIGSWFERVFIPLARYFYPAIIPASILFAWGIYEIFILLNRKTNITPIIPQLIYSLSLIVLTAWAILSILTHYQY